MFMNEYKKHRPLSSVILTLSMLGMVITSIMATDTAVTRHSIPSTSTEDINDTRNLQEIITSPSCSIIRSDYVARLDLVYLYTVHYEVGPFDEDGMTTAIAMSVASKLNECDNADQPLYAVEVSTENHHETIDPDLEGDLCNSTDIRLSNNTTHCNVVRGTTSIFLDRGGAGLEDKMLAAITAALDNNEFYLNQFTYMTLRHAGFEQSIGAKIGLVNINQVSASDSQNGDSVDYGDAVQIAVITASVSLVITAAILIAMYFRNTQEGSVMTASKTVNHLTHLQARRRKYFEQMEADSTLAPGWMMTDGVPGTLPVAQPSITWSVSDLTSDAGSIKSTLPMDRIEEEEFGEDEDSDGEKIEENNIENSQDTVSKAVSSIGTQEERSPVHIDQLEFVAQWNHQFPAANSDDRDSVVDSSEEENQKEEEESDWDVECGERLLWLDESSRVSANEAFRAEATSYGGEYDIESADLSDSTDPEETFDTAEKLQGCQFVSEAAEAGETSQHNYTPSSKGNESSINASLDVSIDDEVHLIESDGNLEQEGNTEILLGPKVSVANLPLGDVSNQNEPISPIKASTESSSFRSTKATTPEIIAVETVSESSLLEDEENLLRLTSRGDTTTDVNDVTISILEPAEELFYSIDESNAERDEEKQQQPQQNTLASWAKGVVRKLESYQQDDNGGAASKENNNNNKNLLLTYSGEQQSY